MKVGCVAMLALQVKILDPRTEAKVLYLIELADVHLLEMLIRSEPPDHPIVRP